MDVTNSEPKMISYKIIINASEQDLLELCNILFQTKINDLCIKNVFKTADKNILDDISSIGCEDFTYYRSGDFIYLNFDTDHVICNEAWEWMCNHYTVSCDVLWIDSSNDRGLFLRVRNNDIQSFPFILKYTTVSIKAYDSALECMFHHDTNQFWYSVRNVLPKCKTEQEANDFIDAAFPYVLRNDRAALYYIMTKKS
jgi:hypothetical protein